MTFVHGPCTNARGGSISSRLHTRNRRTIVEIMFAQKRQFGLTNLEVSVGFWYHSKSDNVSQIAPFKEFRINSYPCTPYNHSNE